jgi:hypothetical protein
LEIVKGNDRCVSPKPGTRPINPSDHAVPAGTNLSVLRPHRDQFSASLPQARSSATDHLDSVPAKDLPTVKRHAGECHL